MQGSHLRSLPLKVLKKRTVSSSIRSVKAIPAEYYKRVFGQLKKFGWLLESDPKLPCVTTIITGSRLHSSWWSHPLAHTIFHVNGQLEDHPDVLVTKLIAGKVTWVHKQLWPEILAIGTAREHWQTNGLSAPAKSLLRMVRSKGFLRTDKINLRSTTGGTKLKAGDLARELERRLLVHAAQVHTDTGAHAKFLEIWEHWASRVGFTATPKPVDEAKAKLEARLAKLNAQFNGAARLPWMD